MRLVFLSFFAFVIFLPPPIGAEEEDALKTRDISYAVNDVQFLSTIVYPGDAQEDLPGVLFFPNWMGPTPESLAKASKVAAEGYVVMMVDMYGIDTRPTDAEEAAEAAGGVRSDRPAMRARARRAHQVFLQQNDLPLGSDSMAAIGFCFGGGVSLEYARSGADLDAVVSFHGDLLSPTLMTDSGDILAKVLVLHGADDPFVPQENVARFRDAMMATDVDWQLVQFGNTVHSFTDPDAAMPGKAEYNETSAKRAFRMMHNLFDEVFAPVGSKAEGTE